MYDLLPMICWYLCEAWKDVRFVAYDLLVSVRGMKRCTICCLWFTGICTRHEKMYDLLPMICWYLCEAWKDIRFVAYDLLVSVRGMKRCTICCLWFVGICARHEKMNDLLPMICWYLCEAWKDVWFVAYDLLVSVRGMKRCTICCLWFAGICARHEKIYDLLPMICWYLCEAWKDMICWYLCEAWKDVRFVAYEIAGICARHEKMYDLLPMICWHLCEAWKDTRFCCLWFAGICARHEKIYDLLPMICWYLCEAWKDVRFVAYDLLVSVRGMKRCTICCLWFAGICARHEKIYDLLPMICWYLCEAWKDKRLVAYDLLVSVRGMKRCTICCLWFAGICARHEKM